MPVAKICFIINPIAGGKNKEHIPGLIAAHLDHQRFQYEVFFTGYSGHATLLAKAALKDFDVICGVGGDGTINEIAKAVCNTAVVFAIIPYGSGNGLARFLGIPLKPVPAIKVLNKLNKLTIDTAQLNGMPFFNMAGIGLDAKISHAFAGYSSRGLATYVKTTIKEYFTYQRANYSLTIDGTKSAHKALIISIANSSQYGNNARIAPRASITDGLLDICIVRAIPLIVLPVFLFGLFFNKKEDKRFTQIIRGRHILIETILPAYMHMDGEPFEVTGPVEINVNPLSLTVVVP